MLVILCADTHLSLPPRMDFSTGEKKRNNSKALLEGHENSWHMAAKSEQGVGKIESHNLLVERKKHMHMSGSNETPCKTKQGLLVGRRNAGNAVR